MSRQDEPPTLNLKVRQVMPSPGDHSAWLVSADSEPEVETPWLDALEAGDLVQGGGPAQRCRPGRSAEGAVPRWGRGGGCNKKEIEGSELSAAVSERMLEWRGWGRVRECTASRSRAPLCAGSRQLQEAPGQPPCWSRNNQSICLVSKVSRARSISGSILWETPRDFAVLWRA